MKNTILRFTTLFSAALVILVGAMVPAFADLTNFPNGISSFGIPVLPASTPAVSTGKVFFVSSGAGGAANSGKESSHPLATLAQALALTTAGKGDVIYLMPGHAETIAASTSVSVSGVQVIGLGTGDLRPIITFSTLTSARLNITGANVSLKNMIFVTGIDSQVDQVLVAATNLTLENCEFRQGSSPVAGTPLTFVRVAHSSANAADRLKILNCRFDAPRSGTQNSAVLVASTNAFIEIKGNKVQGEFLTAGIANAATDATCTDMLIVNNQVINKTASKPAFSFLSACTGVFGGNNIVEGAPSLYSTALKVKNTELSEQVVVKSSASLPQTTDGVLFTVTGGPIEVLNILGEVTTIIQTQADNLSLIATDNASSTGTALSGTVNASAHAVGSFYNITGTLANAMVNTAGGTAISQAGRVVVPAGTISLRASASNTGAIRWFLKYKALSPGVTVTAN